MNNEYCSLFFLLFAYKQHASARITKKNNKRETTSEGSNVLCQLVFAIAIIVATNIHRKHKRLSAFAWWSISLQKKLFQLFATEVSNNPFYGTFYCFCCCFDLINTWLLPFLPILIYMDQYSEFKYIKIRYLL